MNAAEDDVLARAFAAETPIFAAMLAAWVGPAALIVARAAAHGGPERPPAVEPEPETESADRPAWPAVRQLLLVDAQVDQQDPVITASGQLNVLTVGLLDTPVRRALRGQPREVTLDLSGIAALSGAGLDALLELRQAAEVHGAQLTLRAPSRPVRDLLETAGVAAAFDSGLFLDRDRARGGDDGVVSDQTA